MLRDQINKKKYSKNIPFSIENSSASDAGSMSCKICDARPRSENMEGMTSSRHDRRREADISAELLPRIDGRTLVRADMKS
ncbi:jg20204 [Pararge aegeria aegeria]|uniref:Jg20204 protein n=1 Tax=Pararge aegeria aegeria TaxID=348720 RepID=A0A8S4R526_9NEOP|nr:jg20204 [Pararge aegeria aegeria]